MYTQPIRPEDIPQTKKDQIPPPEVIEAFNDLIIQDLIIARRNGQATVRQAIVRQDEVIKLIIAKIVKRVCWTPNEIRHRCGDEGWLNIEEIFRAAGWEVTYDNNPATFTFRTK